MIKKFNDFKINENTSDGKEILTMDDVKKLKHNLGYRRDAGPDSFMKNYSWNEDHTLIVMKGYNKPQIWDGKEVEVCDLYSKASDSKYMSELGYAIKIDGVITYLIGIYEPHGCSLNAKRGVVTAHGHEQIIKLWLDDGEFEEDRTR